MGDWFGAVAFAPNGMLAIGAGSVINLLDANTGAPMGGPLSGHKSLIREIAFSPDGKVLASSSVDRSIRMWDVQTEAPIGEPLIAPATRGDYAYPGYAIAFSPDGKALAANFEDQTVRMWDVQSGQLIGEPLNFHERVDVIAFSPDGRVLTIGSRSCTVRMWDVRARTPIGEPFRGPESSASRVALSPDGTIIASSCNRPHRPDQPFDLWNYRDDLSIHMWNVQTGAPIEQPIRCDNQSIHAIAFSPDGTVLASGLGDGTVRMWDTHSGLPIGEPLRGHRKPVQAIAFSPDSKTIASGSYDCTVRMWDVRTARKTSLGDTFRAHEATIKATFLPPDNQVLASESDEPFKGHSTEITTIAFSPEGGTIASGSHDGMVRMWSAETGLPVGKVLMCPDWPVNAIAISPDSKVLVAGCGYQTGGNRSVNSITFSPDGEVLVPGSKSIMLWDIQTGVPIGEPQSRCFFSSNRAFPTAIGMLPQDPSSPHQVTSSSLTAVPSTNHASSPSIQSPSSIHLAVQGQWVTHTNKRLI